MEQKASILIVDDDESICKTMSLILGRKGYATSTAHSGPEAIASVKDSPFDVILMDIRMPVMDGVQTYKKVKEVRPEAMVVMMTAYSVENLVQEALQEGAYGIIYKPFDIEKAVAIIEKAKQAKKGAFILVVDDDPATCTNFRNILSRRSYIVSIAHTGEEAVTIAKRKHHDIIIIDMKLPTMNGLETYLAIKDIDPEAVVIVMTGYRADMADLVQQALNKSAYACLYKPLNMEEVLRLLEDILKEKKS